MSSSYPIGPRLVAALGALVMGAYFGVLLPLDRVGAGYPLTAATLAATTAPLVVFLALVAAWPDGLQRLLRGRSPLDLRDGAQVAAAVLMAGTIWFVLGFGALVGGVGAYESVVVRGEEQPAVDGGSLFVGLAFNVVVLVVPAFVYVSFVHGGGPRATFRALGFRTEGAGRAILLGFATAIAAVLLIALAGAALDALKVDVPENDRALDIARSVTILGAFGIAAGAAFSEETFFRGFLQARIGLLAQAILFGLAHLSYVNVFQVVVTFALGLAFGIVRRATRNLYAPIAAHFLFNLIMLILGIYAPDAA